MTPPRDRAAELARSYDLVADEYERVSLPLFFDAPARALVAFAGLAPGSRVLDVGAGTGAVGRAVRDGVPGSSVTALDPSLPMLEKARAAGIEQAVVGVLPTLPFLEASFDAVVSAFVMTHLDDADAGARAMRDVVRPGGSVVLSAWTAATDPFAQLWSDVVAEFVPAERLAAMVAAVMPADDRFAREGALAELLVGAGLCEVRDATVSITFTLTAAQFIAARGVCAGGRALRALLSAEDFARCCDRGREAIELRFPGGVSYDRPVFLAVGRR